MMLSNQMIIVCYVCLCLILFQSNIIHGLKFFKVLTKSSVNKEPKPHQTIVQNLVEIDKLSTPIVTNQIDRLPIQRDSNNKHSIEKPRIKEPSVEEPSLKDLNEEELRIIKEIEIHSKNSLSAQGIDSFELIKYRRMILDNEFEIKKHPSKKRFPNKTKENILSVEEKTN